MIFLRVYYKKKKKNYYTTVYLVAQLYPVWLKVVDPICSLKM